MPGTLYLIGLPIGNPEDLTLRARRVLTEVDLLVGESFKEAGRLKKLVGADAPVLALNRDNESDVVPEIVAACGAGQSAAFFSDAGMPVWDDPGLALVRAAVVAGIEVVPLPGVSSVLAALVVSGFPLGRWYYRGFLPAERGARRAALAALNTEPYTTAVLETPYRLRQLLDDMAEVLDERRRAALCWQLTLPDEAVVRGTAAELRAAAAARAWRKGEFVVVLGPNILNS